MDRKGNADTTAKEEEGGDDKDRALPELRPRKEAERGSEHDDETEPAVIEPSYKSHRDKAGSETGASSRARPTAAIEGTR